MHRRAVLGILAAAALGLAWPREAEAAGRILWRKIVVRPGDDAKRVSERLRAALKRASRKAKWGKGSKLELSARVTRLDWETREDVLRVSCTVVARIEGGPGARSHIRLGGRPNERRQLEKQAIGIVSSGLVTRLAEIARSRP